MRADRRQRERFTRLWWAAPLAIAVAAGTAFAVVVVPAATNHVQVPTELQVASTPAPAATHTTHPATVAPRKTTKPRHTAPPTVAPPPAPPAPVHTTRIVTPVHPVVSESGDDSGGDRHEGSGSDDGGGSGDSSSPTSSSSGGDG